MSKAMETQTENNLTEIFFVRLWEYVGGTKLSCPNKSRLAPDFLKPKPGAGFVRAMSRNLK
jgi:hypothetical protein